ncbi:MAG: hypothetical protein R6U98_23485 [Pirellulaceae bacterium]
MRSLGKKGRGAVARVAACVCAVVACPGPAAANVGPDWKTGTAFQRALANRFEVVTWPEGRRFRDQLDQLAKRQRVAIFLDRRIDPDQQVSCSARQVTFAELLNQLAAKVDAVVLHIGSVVYIGPRDLVSGLSRVAEQRAREARALPGRRERALLAKRSWRWDALAEPRLLLDELAEEARVTIDGTDKIPHDLWPGTELPPLRWTDRVTLLLAGFGLTFELADQGRAIDLVPLPKAELLARSYDTSLSEVNWERVAEQFPQADIQRFPESIEFRGTPEEHNRLRELLSRQASPKPDRPPQGKTVHSLRVARQPIGAILKTIQDQLEVEFEFGAAVRQKLQTRVTFDLHNVSIDELLEATLTPASLTT